MWPLTGRCRIAWRHASCYPVDPSCHALGSRLPRPITKAVPTVGTQSRMTYAPSTIKNRHDPPMLPRSKHPSQQKRLTWIARWQGAPSSYDDINVFEVVFLPLFSWSKHFRLYSVIRESRLACSLQPRNATGDKAYRTQRSSLSVSSKRNYCPQQEEKWPVRLDQAYPHRSIVAESGDTMLGENAIMTLCF